MSDEMRIEATPAKSARKSGVRRPKAAPVTRQQVTAGFAGSVALGQLITMALAKWLGVM